MCEMEIQTHNYLDANMTQKKIKITCIITACSQISRGLRFGQPEICPLALELKKIKIKKSSVNKKLQTMTCQEIKSIGNF